MALIERTLLAAPDGGLTPNDFHRLKTQNQDEIVRVSLESQCASNMGGSMGGQGVASPLISVVYSQLF